MTDVPHYEFDVFTAEHDDMKGGGEYAETRVRVVVSTDYTFCEAYEVAACMAVATNGGMPTRVLPRY